MIIDSSAIVAVVMSEADARVMLSAMLDSDHRRVSAGTWLETCVVINRRRFPRASAIFEGLMETLALQIDPVTVEQAMVARRAYERFGRGNHPARLNYGDCFAYALAKVTGEPLLFKGDDFSQTDIRPAI